MKKHPMYRIIITVVPGELPALALGNFQNPPPGGSPPQLLN